MSKEQFVSCVIVDDYGKVLLLHNYASTPTRWELPGGEVEEGQLAEEAAVRALDDGLGIGIRLIKSLGNAISEDDDETEYIWFQAVIARADPELNDTDLFDDLAYFDTEDLLSLALSESMQLLFDKIMSGEVVLDTPYEV